MSFNNTPALRQVFVLETTHTDCPMEVVAEVDDLWADHEFGNDVYYYKFSLSSDPSKLNKWSDEVKYPIIAAYLRSHGVSSCLIHNWW